MFRPTSPTTTYLYSDHKHTRQHTCGTVQGTTNTSFYDALGQRHYIDVKVSL
jgi:hypothetical protein